MKRNLKQFFAGLLLVTALIGNNYNDTFAYSEEEEEISDKYTQEMDEKVNEIVNKIIKREGYSLKSSNKFTVVLDPGHGGKDPGTSGYDKSGNKFLEKVLNLQIAQAAEKKLESYGINVIMTRESDLAPNQKLELSERAEIANKLGAELFISFHNDAGGGDGAHVIHSIHGGLGKTLATDIAKSIEKNTSQNLKKYNPIWSRPHVNDSGQTVDYYGVIRMTKMPAVIIEHAFLDNKNDIEAVNTTEKTTIMGNAVAEGIYKTISENFGRWVEKDGNTYYYDHDGKMVIGWMNHYDGNWYYFNPDGVMETGWEYISGAWYYLYENGKMATDTWQKQGDEWYYLKANGIMAIGWYKVDGEWYYLKSNGAMQVGWLLLDDKWYYLNYNGSMAKGWKQVKDEWYYFESSGVMLTGWQRISGEWYYLKENGKMSTGWLDIDGTWYYLRSNGIMVTEWREVKGEWYYFKSSGVMATGWQKVNGVWYYLRENGKMATGWLELGYKTYYLKSNGVMITGTATIDNKVYKFASSGELIK